MAVKSFEDLVDKPKVEIYQDNIYDKIEINITEMSQLKRIFQKIDPKNMFIIHNQINRFRYGQAVIICASYNCRMIQSFNPHLHLINTEDQRYHSFQVLQVKKFHSHSNKIFKL